MDGVGEVRVRVRSDHGPGAFASGPLLQEGGGSTELGAPEPGCGGYGEQPDGAALAPGRRRLDGVGVLPLLAAEGHVIRRGCARTIELGVRPRGRGLLVPVLGPVLWGEGGAGAASRGLLAGRSRGETGERP